MKVLY